MQIMKKIVKVLFCKILYKVEYSNIENVKEINRCLICPNHSSIFDPTFIYAIVEDLYIMAKSELFKNRCIRWLLTKYNIFPINREKVDVQSTMYSLNIFKGNDNKRLLMFPEGKVIKEENEIKRYYKKGAVFIAANSNVPIIPVYITRRPKFFTKVRVIFGQPIYITKEEINDKMKIKEKSRQLIEEIYKLSN